MATDVRLPASRSASSKVDCSSSGDFAVFFATLSGTSARNPDPAAGPSARMLVMGLESDLEIERLSHRTNLPK